MDVELIHLHADFEALRAKNLNVLREIVSDLATISTGLARPVPKIATLIERLAQTMDDANRQIAKLEAMK